MKKKLVFLFYFVLFFFNIQSQQMSYDSVVAKVSDRTLSIDDRYNYVRYMSHLPVDEQIVIAKTIKDIVRNEKDKAKLITIFTILDNLYSIKGKIEEGKNYLDSAFIYVNRTNNFDVIGELYYKLGFYYSKRSDLPNSNKLQLEYFYKSIPYFEKSENSYYKLAKTYSLINSTYIAQKDFPTSKTILNKMYRLKLDRSNIEKASLFHVYSSAEHYYSGLKSELVKPGIQPQDTSLYYMYLDSSVYFINKSIDVYKTLKDSIPAYILPKSLVATCYFDLALEKSLKYTIDSDKNWPEVFNYLEEGKIYLDSTDYIGWHNYHLTKGRTYQGLKNFKEANIEYVKAKEILDNNQNMYNLDEHYLRIYKQMVVANWKMGNCRDALLYQVLYTNVQEKCYTAERYRAVKELEVKYQTAEKELEISRLNEEQQEILYNRTLYNF